MYFSFGHLGLRISEQAFDGLQNVEGRFRRRSKGGVEFRCANASANTISELAEWIESEVDDHPELAELIDARLSVCDASGEVIERYRDDDAWDYLRVAYKES